MGLYSRKWGCNTNYRPPYNEPFESNTRPIAPNPDPKRWTLIDKAEYPNGYVLKVRYLDCTNFEGLKVMVYKGKFTISNHLDPHFTNDINSPIARFRPNKEGWSFACNLARSL